MKINNITSFSLAIRYYILAITVIISVFQLRKLRKNYDYIIDNYMVFLQQAHVEVTKMSDTMRDLNKRIAVLEDDFEKYRFDAIVPTGGGTINAQYQGTINVMKDTVFFDSDTKLILSEDIPDTTQLHKEKK